MYKWDFTFYELRINQQTQTAEPVPLVRSFFSAETPKEMNLLQYQNMMLAIVDMPLWARVLFGFVTEQIQPDLAEERFTFKGLSAQDFKELYDCAEALLLTILCDENKQLINAQDLVPLRTYLTDDDCENFSRAMFEFLAEIIAKTFLAVSNKSFYENYKTQGKNVFDVGGRKFFLPAKAVMEFTNLKATQKKISKVEFDNLMKRVSDNTFDNYSTWQATTAIDFYELSQSFEIIHNGIPISREKLNSGNKIEFRNSAAAIFAALSREVKSISEDGKIELVPKFAKRLDELEQSTAEMINFFNEHLTMDEAHQCNFFFVNLIAPTKNFITLPLKNPQPQKQKRGQRQKRKYN